MKRARPRVLAHCAALVATVAMLSACGGGSDSSNSGGGVAPSALSYPSPVEVTVGIQMNAVWPTVQGTVTRYSVTPALPAGISIDAADGAIVGTPTAVTVWGNYTVTAENASGSTTFSLSLAVTGPSADGLAPSTPGALTVTVGSPTELDVTWMASTDNVGVVGYHVSRDGALAATVGSSPFNDRGLVSGVQHCYTVTAFDAWRNESPPGNPVCATPAHRAPVASLTAPAGTLTGAAVTFDAGHSYGVDGAIVLYRFDFGDGSPAVLQAGPTIQHTYSALGSYTATVTVTDNAMATATASAPVTDGLVLSQPTNVSRTSLLSQTPSVFREADGSIDAVWEESRSDLMFARSVDGGRSFSPASYVLDPASQWGSQDGFVARQMQVVAAHGFIHVAWSIFDQINGGAEIFYERSADSGVTWSAPLIVSTVDTYGSYAPSITAEGDGSVFVTWFDDDEGAGPLNGIKYTHSNDDGASFSPPGTLVLQSNTSCPSAVGSSKLIGVAWPRGPIGAGQLMFDSSSDGGQSFLPPRALDAPMEHVWCPHLAWDGQSTIYTTWEEDTATYTGRVLFSVSTDAGATFSPAIALSSLSAYATSPVIASGAGGRVYVSWQEGWPGPTTAFLAFSSDAGKTFTPALRIDTSYFGTGGGGFTQVLAVDSNHLALVTNGPPSAGAQGDIFYINAEISLP
jgi:hypothetical protein